MLKIKATFTPQVYKPQDTSSVEGYVDGEPEVVVIIQITQFDEDEAWALFVDSAGNLRESKIGYFSKLEVGLP